MHKREDSKKHMANRHNQWFPWPTVFKSHSPSQVRSHDRPASQPVRTLALPPVLSLYLTWARASCQVISTAGEYGAWLISSKWTHLFVSILNNYLQVFREHRTFRFFYQWWNNQRCKFVTWNADKGGSLRKGSFLVILGVIHLDIKEK